jgi:hypothetical protein
MARHVASPRLVPQANRLGLAWYSQAESALCVMRMTKYNWIYFYTESRMSDISNVRTSSPDTGRLNR